VNEYFNGTSAHGPFSTIYGVCIRRTVSLSVLTAIFLSRPGLAGSRMSPFWILLKLRMMEVVVATTATKTCKVPVKWSPPTNQHPAFYRPDAVPVAQPTAALKGCHMY